MIRNEYVRFMQTLADPSVTDDVRKLANLVLENLALIQPLGTNQGQRVKKITQLAQEDWKSFSHDITVKASATNDSDASISRLKSLRVGPFRGFAREENFNLDSELVLIYGPNGTGKSSFCEALEYGLLGNVAEAETKRFRSQEDYFKNAHTNKFSKPIIEAVDTNGVIHPLISDESIYRFCFVEKNRIDNFSRIAAHAPARQTELISSLFGLDKFNDFVRGFSVEIDQKYIDLAGAKKNELQQKEQTLQGHKLTIEQNKNALTELEKNESELAQRYAQNTTFSEMITSLGTAECPGRISEIETELQRATPLKTGLTVKALSTAIEIITNADIRLKAKSLELAQASESVSFKKLYSAIQTLKDSNGNFCPACKTPLEKTTFNPFTLATSELDKLAHLTQIELERDEYEEIRTNGIASVYKILQLASESHEESGSRCLTNYLLPETTKISWEWWASLHALNTEDTTGWNTLQERVQHLEMRDTQINSIVQDRESKNQTLQDLRQFAKEGLILQTQRKGMEASTETATAVIAAFDEQNKDLIDAVEKEKSTIEQNQKIANAYAQTIALLSAYKDQLPNLLVADLGDKVAELYNAFNRYDSEQDLIAKVKLPLTSGQRIEISFKNKPDIFFDALHVLSEGHIRCIGLAILLAKNLKEKCPILVFDDPVNAIDEEHRKAIRITLFKDSFFSTTQIILACHGNEFFKDTHQIIGIENAQNSESYIFSNQTQEKHIQVNSLSRPVNYILAATTLNDLGESRDALMSARRALEEICPKIWIHYNKHGGGPISLLQRAPNIPIDLRTLADKLRGEIGKAKFEIKNRETISDSLNTLLGPNGSHTHWVYLNKGTHEEEDREEFDKIIVSEIIESLIILDKSIA
nr:AAA family ATPase [uncultured bacterium]